MLGVENAVENGVAEEHIGVSHINLRAKHLLAIGILTLLHLLKESEVLLHGAIAIGALGTSLLNSTTTEANLLLSLVVNISLTLLNEFHSPIVELVEVVRSVALHSPIKAEPLDILLDGIYILGVLLHGVGVIETQIALTIVALCKTKVQADTLCVTDVQVAVGLGREARLNGVTRLGDIVFNNFFYKVERPLFGCFCGFYFHNEPNLSILVQR